MERVKRGSQINYTYHVDLQGVVRASYELQGADDVAIKKPPEGGSLILVFSRNDGRARSLETGKCEAEKTQQHHYPT